MLTLAERRRERTEQGKLPPGDRFKQAREISGHNHASFSFHSGISMARIVEIESNGQASEHERHKYILLTGFRSRFFHLAPCADFAWCSLDTC